MLQLRIRQHAVAEGRHRVEIDLLGDGAPRAAVSTFDFRLSSQDEEDLRWYLEDFLQYPQEPAPAIARAQKGCQPQKRAPFQGRHGQRVEVRDDLKRLARLLTSMEANPQDFPAIRGLRRSRDGETSR